MDTALFVLAAAILHGVVGLVVLYVAEWFAECRVVATAAALASGTFETFPKNQACSVHFGLGLGVVEFMGVSALALYVGSRLAKITTNARIAKAVFGPYYEQRNGDSIVIANIMTKITHSGCVVMYEGKVDEISIGASRKINYVCIIKPQRFLLKINEKTGLSSTTHRSRFVSIDRDGYPTSRMTISGEDIANLLTRTHPVILEDDEQAGDRSSRRELFQGIINPWKWFRRRP
ncbi:hypothetical protein [Pseudoroseomonas sp. WGS1072]|uniref:hypothetical protein n=1 Tax=Roseomonas sp. WGS1072 TaxID=3366816 RepID=UPI003BF0E300